MARRKLSPVEARTQGRERSKLWTTALKRALARSHGTVDKGLLAVAEVVIKQAMDGDRLSQFEIANRIEGKVKEQVILDANVMESVRVDDARSIANKLRGVAATYTVVPEPDGPAEPSGDSLH